MESKDSVTIVVFSGELDKALAAFNIANTAASMGMKVSMFFTFWGLSVIQKGKSGRGKKDTLQYMMGKMNRSGASKLKLSKMNMMGMGGKSMKSLMKKYRMPSLEEMITLAREQGVEFVACTTSIALMGLEKGDFIDEVDRFAGASTYLGLASESNVNLFI
ncbi:MAG: DsrE/DsrF/DrsH-like family protein [Actinobacteria bacterium]|nr:DsrE/DsrF/DrsH-like family protein [Actinomycetota bacterium]